MISTPISRPFLRVSVWAGTLIVIGILCSIPIGQRAATHSMDIRAANACRNLCNAIAAYHTEHRKWPVDFSGNGIVICSSSRHVMNALCQSSDVETHGTAPRNIVFYTDRKAERMIKSKKLYGGLARSTAGDWSLYDPWGRYYEVVIEGTDPNSERKQYIKVSSKGKDPDSPSDDLTYETYLGF